MSLVEKSRTEAFESFLNDHPIDRIQSVLDELCEAVNLQCKDQFEAAFLATAVPCDRPGKPVLSSNSWISNFLDDRKDIRSLSKYLSTCKESTTFSLKNMPNELNSILDAINNIDPKGVSIFPLSDFRSKESASSNDMNYALIAVHSNDPDPRIDSSMRKLSVAPYIRFIDFILKVTHFDQLVARGPHLAETFDASIAAVVDLGWLTPVDQSSFGDNWNLLVDKVLTLIPCDTCQLYLQESYLGNVCGSGIVNGIRLIAESVHSRKGLRYFLDDVSLTTHLWKDKEGKVLCIPNLPSSPDYKDTAAGKFGHARHFIGMPIRDRARHTLGVIKLRDKLEEVDGKLTVSKSGFDPNNDAKVLTDWSRKLSLDLSGALVESIATDLESEVGRLRESLAADTCLLFLHKSVLARFPSRISNGIESTRDYLELFCAKRENWKCRAHYEKGEGLTGKVYESGNLLNVHDVVSAVKQEAVSEPKYRLSRHFLGAPIKLRDEVIGVLKVRDPIAAHTEPDGLALTSEGFSTEHEHLLSAFANLIPVKLQFKLIQEAGVRRTYGMLTQAFHDSNNRLVLGNSSEDVKREVGWFQNRCHFAAVLGLGLYGTPNFKTKESKNWILQDVLKKQFTEPNKAYAKAYDLGGYSHDTSPKPNVIVELKDWPEDLREHKVMIERQFFETVCLLLLSCLYYETAPSDNVRKSVIVEISVDHDKHVAETRIVFRPKSELRKHERWDLDRPVLFHNWLVAQHVPFETLREGVSRTSNMKIDRKFYTDLLGDYTITIQEPTKGR